jgi:CheY-like chemotaxis protein
MYYNIAILLLLLIIGGIAFYWVKHKRSKQSLLVKDFESLKDGSMGLPADLITRIMPYDDPYDACIALLKSIQVLEEENRILEQYAHEVEKEKFVLPKGLGQRNEEIVSISHKMRTSLSGLLGFTNFLRSTKLSHEQDEFVSIISTSANELLTLVNSIIDPTNKMGSSEKSSQMVYKNKIPYVLVVDDNEINKKLLAKVLGDHNLKVAYASNGEEAVALRKENSFDIIFMDIQMPVMDGVEASKAIREYENDSNISPVPIVAITGNVAKEDREVYLDAGMTDYIAKPIMAEDIRKRLAPLY